MSAPQISSSAVYAPSSYQLVKQHSSDGSYWFMGCVVTRHGIVSVYSESTFTRLCKVRGGRCVEAVWRRGFSQRYLVTLATRFASED